MAELAEEDDDEEEEEEEGEKIEKIKWNKQQNIKKKLQLQTVFFFFWENLQKENADCHLTLRQGSPKYNKETTTEEDEATRHG